MQMRLNQWEFNSFILVLLFLIMQPNFKDYPVYLAKFKQCLSKAVHFMKVHITNSMQNLTSQLLKRVSSGQMSIQAHFMCLV